jgi:hypothetical protein
VHGSRAVVHETLSALSQCDGTRVALPGEFTKRYNILVVVASYEFELCVWVVRCALCVVHCCLSGCVLILSK